MKALPESNSNCSRCGAPFACGAQSPEPCWCASLPALEPVPGRDCLCRDCLKAELGARHEL